MLFSSGEYFAQWLRIRATVYLQRRAAMKRIFESLLVRVFRWHQAHLWAVYADGRLVFNTSSNWFMRRCSLIIVDFAVSHETERLFCLSDWNTFVMNPWFGVSKLWFTKFLTIWDQRSLHLAIVKNVITVILKNSDDSQFMTYSFIGLAILRATNDRLNLFFDQMNGLLRIALLRSLIWLIDRVFLILYDIVVDGEHVILDLILALLLKSSLSGCHILIIEHSASWSMSLRK